MNEAFLIIFLITFTAAIVVLYFRIGRGSGWKKPKRLLSNKDRSILSSKVQFYKDLSSDDKKKFEFRAVEFLENVKVSGVDAKVTRGDELLVASGAIIPVFRFKDWQYTGINEVLLYPGGFNDSFQDGINDDGTDNMGMVGDGPLDKKMILSKDDLHNGFKNPRSHTNVAVHEFIHLIEKETGATEGVPKLFAEGNDTAEWAKLAKAEIGKINAGKSDIIEYAAEDMQEFFATVSEYFFMDREMFRSKHPELYEFLERMFKIVN
mgnify:FL=1|jgi:MtfA peptidase